MLKLILVSLLFSLMAVGCANTSGVNQSDNDALVNESEPVRVMSFNIRFDNPDDGPNAWPNRKDFVASVIRFHHAHLIGIQEGLHHQVQALDELLPEYGRVGVGRDDGNTKGEFAAIYYHKQRFEPVENGTFWLSETPDSVGSVGWDAALPRIVTWAKFLDKKNQHSFYAFNTHFDHRGIQARTESAKLIREKITEIAGSSPVVLTGDFNALENQEPYKVLTETQTGSLKLFDGFHHSRYSHHGPNSTSTGFEAIRPGRRIDYIFVNSGFSFIHHGSLTDVRDGRFPSDHLPVLSEIMINP